MKLTRVRMTDFINNLVQNRGADLAEAAAVARKGRLVDAYRRAAQEMAHEMRPARQRAEEQRRRRAEGDVAKLEKGRRNDVAAFNNAEETAWAAKAPKVKE